MKKLILTLALAVAAATASAQKFALIDTEYILKNVPAYERASEQLNQISRKWQAEVETLSKEAETLAKNYESESVYLSEEQKTAKIQEVFDKENEAAELKRQYFGPEGELFKKRESLIKPIQDELYNAVKEIAESKGYSVVIDRATAADIIYASPKIDISNDVLDKMGYGQ
ncbi:MAG TPA: OmpH family outer membrane protein [Candidatus Avibacteroides avistercoris]|uniref:OmpH family outer membrane protein n=1 Tax=Candidatus Avibacteroides avistercoris TaxID=2840690 RepID=A0A9D2UJJ6_9BACT|nr:OmpH family outer membrane protein [Candidatus Avibacteroides avistercoris]